MNVTAGRTLSFLLVLPAVSESANAHGPSIDVDRKVAMPNVPGKILTAMTVIYQPGGRSRPHRHPQSGFLYVHVLSGTVRSQVEGEASRLYAEGESWIEGPGAHHLRSENASSTEAARILVVAIADTGAVLTEFDK